MGQGGSGKDEIRSILCSPLFTTDPIEKQQHQTKSKNSDDGKPKELELTTTQKAKEDSKNHSDGAARHALSQEVSYTTRPMREGEENGKTYHFIDKELFMTMKENDEFYECLEFNSWMYGCTKDEFHSKQVFIMTPTGVKQIHKPDRKDCLVVLLTADEDVRRTRMNARKPLIVNNIISSSTTSTKQMDSTERRLKADEKDFKEFYDYDLLFENNGTDKTQLSSIASAILEYFHREKRLSRIRKPRPGTVPGIAWKK